MNEEPAEPTFSGCFFGIYISDAVKDDLAWLDNIWQNQQTCSFDSNSFNSFAASYVQEQTYHNLHVFIDHPATTKPSLD